MWSANILTSDKFNDIFQSNYACESALLANFTIYQYL